MESTSDAQIAVPEPAHLIPIEAPPPPDRHPAAVYLAGLSTAPGRAGMASALKRVAGILGAGTVETTPWHRLRFAHVAALRTRLVEEGFAPASANKMLSAVRGVLRAAWRLGLMTSDEYSRATDVGNVKGSRLPAGRALDTGEVVALFAACADGTAAGHRDAAAFSLMFGAGLRRAEAAAVQVGDVDPETGAIRIVGKGNRERIVYATNGGLRAVTDWIAVRGRDAGPLLCRVSQVGVVTPSASMTPAALLLRLKRRSRQANIAECSPHDLRRSFVSGLLDAGADISAVSRLAGHASVQTTTRYDRRDERASQRAATLLHVPYVGTPAAK